MLALRAGLEMRGPRQALVTVQHPDIWLTGLLVLLVLLAATLGYTSTNAPLHPPASPPNQHHLSRSCLKPRNP
ncbi:hypothetical protein T484DRAFT_2904663 [Baffinella frigidus]|nr:hypothetical protein T484DRAFT_2904663 [Cryptophyta sp. CCMP2293]